LQRLAHQKTPWQAPYSGAANSLSPIPKKAAQPICNAARYYSVKIGLRKDYPVPAVSLGGLLRIIIQHHLKGQFADFLRNFASPFGILLSKAEGRLLYPSSTEARKSASSTHHILVSGSFASV